MGVSAEPSSAFRDERTSYWTCPEYVCSLEHTHRFGLPKRNNTDTSVKGIVMNETFTPTCFMNTERGSRVKSAEISTDDKGNVTTIVTGKSAEMNCRHNEQMEASKTLSFHKSSNRRIINSSRITKLKYLRAVVEEKTEWGVAAANDRKKKEEETTTPVGECKDNTSFAFIFFLN